MFFIKNFAIFILVTLPIFIEINYFNFISSMRNFNVNFNYHIIIF